jgi:hypothetical protein
MATQTKGKVFATMNARRTSRLVSVAFVAMLAASANNCADQREPECTTAAFGNYNTRLVEIGSGQGTCDPEPVPALIEDDPATEDVDESEANTREDLIAVARAEFINGLRAPLRLGLFGLRPFVQLGSDRYPDFTIPQKVAIQHEVVGDLRDDAAGRLDGFDPFTSAFAFGQFTTQTPQGNLCSIPTFDPAVLELPEIAPRDPDPGDPEDEEDDDPGDLGQPAVTITSGWSDVQILVTTGYPGVQFQGTYTLEAAGCTRTYRATGIFGGNGSFGCEGTNPNPDPEGDPIPNGTPDPSQCDPLITGINPDFPVVCDPELLTCLLPEGSFPAIPLVTRVVYTQETFDDWCL